MESRLFNRLRFILERWIQGGAGHQLLVTAGIIGVIAVLAGTLAWSLSGSFGGYGDAIWWSFLRLTDPGYLGDDEGALLRVISTVVTVLGYVLFLGSLIAIMTQWLNGTIRRLESGLSPITVSGHTLILGWTNRTPNLLRELLAAEAGLGLNPSRSRRIVIQASAVTPELRAELRETLGEDYDRWRIILRSGSAVKVEHLRRVDFEHAETIIIPGSDYSLGGFEASDARVIKTLITIAHHIDGTGRDFTLPHVVAEILDSSRMQTVEWTYRGPLQALATDAFINRLIAQNLRHPGLSTVYTELLSHSTGNEIYSARFPQCAGEAYETLQARFDEAILIGIVRPENGRFRAILNPPPGLRVEIEDFCVAIARSPGSFEPSRAVPSSPRSQPINAYPARERDPRRVLILGWNHRVHELIEEIGRYHGEHSEIELIAPIPLADRGLGAANDDLRMVGPKVRHLEGDYTEEAVLGRVDFSHFDSILLLGNNWMAGGDETDAQTLLGFVLLQSLLARLDSPPPVLVELMNPETAPLLSRDAESIVSPVIVSHVLAHLALRPELNSVFSELFASDGPEIYFRPVAETDLTGETVTFASLIERSAMSGEVCLGVRSDRHGTLLNPSRDRTWTLDGSEYLIQLGARTAGYASDQPSESRG
jgi:ion channel POLLUX/CASTOR